MGQVLQNETEPPQVEPPLPPRRPAAIEEAPAPVDAEALLAPFGAGSRLARWRVRDIEPLRDGSVSVVLTDAAGMPFQLDIYARDTSAASPTPPASSERFDVFLANGGSGARPSVEDHGLAAMALAEVLRQNEARLDCRQFVTLRARLAESPGAVQRVV